MKFQRLMLTLAALLALSGFGGVAQAAPPSKAAKPPSVHVKKSTKKHPEAADAAEMKPVVHVDPELPAGVSRHATVIALTQLAYDELEKYHLGTEEIGGHHAVLALWDPADPGYGLDIVNILDGRSRSEGVDIEVIKRNGVGSQYLVTSDKLEVLALRTNVTDETWKTTSKRKVKQPIYKKKKRVGWKWVTKTVVVTHFTTEPVSYIPHSAALDSHEMHADGHRYLDDLDQVARWILYQRDVRSKTDPSKRIIDVVPPLQTEAILINEHTDHDEYDQFGATWTTDKVFTVTAANRDVTYDYSGSWAGAYGYAQFIRSSYEATVKSCPKAKLIKDFRDGMRDHVNAVMAQYCYMDATLMALGESQRAWLLKPEHRDWLALWLAAAYNGAPARAAKAFTQNRASWTVTPCSALPRKVRRQKLAPCLAEETLFYLKKLKGIRPYLQRLHDEAKAKP